MTIVRSLAVAVALSTAAPALAMQLPPAVQKQAAVADALAPSMVRVEYTLKEDRGEFPGWLGVMVAGAGQAFPRASGEMLIEEERPLEVFGYLVAPDVVFAEDAEVASRFVSSIAVRFGDQVVRATPTAWAKDDAAVYLKLEKPLAGAKPLTFAPSTPADAKLVAAHWAPGDGDWSLVVREASAFYDLESPDGAKRATLQREGSQLVVDMDGRVHGAYVLTSTAAADQRPADLNAWTKLDKTAMDAMLASAKTAADNSVLQVSLTFRSPRKGQMQQMMFEAESAIETEHEALGVLLGSGTILVLAELDPKTTARLERILVRDASGTEHVAEFGGSLRDWGAFVAKVPESLSGGATLLADNVVSLRNRLLPVAEVRLVGRTRLNDANHTRLRSFQPGFRGIQFPVGVSNEESAFVFLPSGELAALPLSVRTQPGQGRQSWMQSSSTLCGSSVVASVLSDLSKSVDPQNVPLSEEDESRTAWLGVMLQPLDPELARANNVAEFTRDGEFGGLVTFVYPGSPAEAAGIEPGAILLQVRSPRRQKPIEVRVDRMDLGFPGVFPWERLDELPEEYYDQIRAPWPPIDDSLAQTLTELGLGAPLTIEFVQGGEKKTKDLTVTQSPSHYGNAPKFESKDLGVTVRDLTLEVRQYLSLAPDAPGVIVAKLEPGQRASVAGLRPLEIITEVDGEPVKDSASFGALVEGKKDLKFTVNRAGNERVLRVAMEK
jgi:serine protease Do